MERRGGGRYDLRPLVHISSISSITSTFLCNHPYCHCLYLCNHRHCCNRCNHHYLQINHRHDCNHHLDAYCHFYSSGIQACNMHLDFLEVILEAIFFRDLILLNVLIIKHHLILLSFLDFASNDDDDILSLKGLSNL